jgi:quercetin dioxygenase-like cupin family protein
MSNRYPFTQKRLSENVILRKFSRDVSETMLEWHRDRQDRVVEVIHGDGWMFQRDNSIPVQISEGSTFKIRANEWHRVIKGKGDLIVKITESKKKKPDGMRSIRKGADSNPKVTKMDFLPDEVLDDIADEIDEAASDNPQYAAGRSASNQACLDAAVNAYNKAKDTPGKKDDQAAIKRREKCAEGKSPVRLSESQLRVMINDALEEIKLDTLLNEIEDQINERKRKKKGKKKTKKSGSRKLSKAVKKSLDKKADKRCLTRGSVYSEFRKGLGAYYTSGSRKGMSAHQWAHARVNSANPSKKWAVVKKRKKCPKKKKK